MKLLLVVATQPEIEPLLSAFSFTGTSVEKQIGRYQVSILVTGAGMVPTAFALGQHLDKSYNLIINAGIAGSFDFGLSIGDVCLVKQDTFAELGAEDDEDFLSIEQLGLGSSTHSANPISDFSAEGLKEVIAITVNKVHGNEMSIAKAIARFNPQIETMEGAAFFYSCHQMNIPAIQIRAISNYVERRNREKWDIPLAIKNLNNTLIELLEK